MSDCNDTVLKRLAEIMKTGEESDVEFIVGKGEQQKKKQNMSVYNVLENLAEIMETGEESDIEFIVGKGKQQKKIRGHKLLFKIASPVFKSLFFGDWGKKTEVEIDDIDPAIFQTMMRYIYTGNSTFETTINAALVYKVAHKFDLPNLRAACKIYMSLNLTPDDVCTILQILDSYEETELKNSCINLIKTKTSAVLDSKGFIDCDERILKMIVNTDVMDVKEFQLFDAVNVWAIHNAEKKGISVLTYAKKLKSIKNNIRFLSMTVSEFESGPAHSLLLSSEEQLNILLNIIRPGSKPLPEGFCSSTESRKCKTPTESKRINSLLSIITTNGSEDENGFKHVTHLNMPNIFILNTCNPHYSSKFSFANINWKIEISKTRNRCNLHLTKSGGNSCKIDLHLKIKSLFHQSENVVSKMDLPGVTFPAGYFCICRIISGVSIKATNLIRLEVWMKLHNTEECDYNEKENEEQSDDESSSSCSDYDQ
ncbi:uncharacterized protein LOC142317323 isoform X2 [Lycorma delicatula]|uniref:uncharacterized protein LOC142317323 isoform X2 n=1 Tax=Lycorma delicatula TaxID=130591 RepID=UPI003F50FDA2